MNNDMPVYDVTQTVPIYVDVHTNHIEKNTMTFCHYHSNYELFFVASGTSEFIFPDCSYTLNKGDVLIIPPYTIHTSRYAISQTTYRLEVGFFPDALNTYYKTLMNSLCKSKVVFIPSKQQDNLYSLIKKLNKEVSRPDSYSVQLSHLYLSEILILLSRYGVTKSIDNAPTNIVQQVMNYIDNNYTKKINTTDIAKHIHVSERTLFHEFKKSTNLTINEYINSVRISHAEKLLKSSEYSIMEISSLCGFNDSNYFSTVFKKYKGVSPNNFRKNNL